MNTSSASALSITHQFTVITSEPVRQHLPMELFTQTSGHIPFTDFRQAMERKCGNYSNVQTAPVIAKGVIYLGIGAQMYAIKTPTYRETELLVIGNSFSVLTIILVALFLIVVALLVLYLWKKRSYFSDVSG